MVHLKNFSVLIFGVYHIYKWSREEGHIWKGTSNIDLETRNRNFYGAFGAKRSYWKLLLIILQFLIILLPLVIQVGDSLIDAVYFVELKSKSRLIHVPAFVQVIQGGLLYTCEYKRFCQVLKSFFH